MAKTTQTIDQTQTTNSQQSQDSTENQSTSFGNVAGQSNTSKQEGAAVMGSTGAALGALPGYTAAFDAGKQATNALANTWTVANTGSANYVPGNTGSMGRTLQPTINSTVTSLADWYKNIAGSGYDFTNPIFTNLRNTNDATSQRSFTDAMNNTKDKLLMSGAYGGTGANDVMAQAVSRFVTDENARHAQESADWMNRIDGINAGMPAAITGMGTSAMVPDQLQKTEFDANQANDQDILDFYRQQLSAPLAQMGLSERYLSNLNNGAFGSNTENRNSSTDSSYSGGWQDSSGNSSTDMTGSSTTNTNGTNTTQTKSSMFENLMSLAGLATSAVGAFGNPFGAAAGMLGKAIPSATAPQTSSPVAVPNLSNPFANSSFVDGKGVLPSLAPTARLSNPFDPFRRAA